MIRIDARGMRCPWPAIRLARALRENAGEPVEIWADDPAAERELAELARTLDARLVVTETPGCNSFRVFP